MSKTILDESGSGEIKTILDESGSGEIKTKSERPNFVSDKEEIETIDSIIQESESSNTTETYPGVENYINKKRLEILKENFTRELIMLIREEEFEYGSDTKADILVRKRMEQNVLATKEWLTTIFIENFTNTRILLGVLIIISRFDYFTIYPEGQLMATTALSHKDPEIQECGVRAFENWGNRHSLRILKNIKASTEWLQEYINEVIDDLEKELHGITSKKN
ncbi:MAG: hypothetical protein ACTSQY_10950 [Candidatus Odinarchaeia archaeon]